ncbi:MAG: valine--tRNA ligase [Dehalococcoidia bacterium]|nr:valine--tRNA ligase [Dehalococcoidia bacterium]
MPKAYDASLVEQRLYKSWLDRNLFAPREDPDRQPFTIIQPPPNVTGELHLGHALTATIEDTMARWHRMQGDPTLWLPGTDHAGIATQVVVERELAKRNLSRKQLGREKFLEEVWEWVKKYRTRIGEQHHRLGASVDWSRNTFTLDPGPSLAVRTTFVNMHAKKLIERGERMINWCPKDQTALSDLEVEHQEANGYMWHIKYPLADGSGHVTVATTRPETMLGDTAVAVHPGDARYRSVVGRHVKLPLTNRTIPVIADDYVDPQFGTGALKITPGHDPNDFEVGTRHHLPLITVIGLDGNMNKEAGPAYAGLERYAARKKIVEDLETQGLLDKVESHRHAVGHCQRCRTVVEPLVSKQWFMRMKTLAAPALRAVQTGEIKIIPEHFTKVYANWMENIQDWCISRQLWWGHRIPVWYCITCDGDKITLSLTLSETIKAALRARMPESAVMDVLLSAPSAIHGTLERFLSDGLTLPEIDAHIETSDISMDVKPLVSLEPPAHCPTCRGTNLFQDPDVLDTWFSSGLWPESTLGWPNDSLDFKRFYPTQVMETGYDILFFWVARMIMMGIENTGQVPFKTVYLHGLVRDAEGAKMSKTRGNVIDPLKVIDTYGADALRFALTTGNAAGSDARLGTPKMEAGRNFANKLWNASRFVLLSIDAQSPPSPAGREPALSEAQRSRMGGEGESGAGQVRGWQNPTPHALEDRWILSRLAHVTAEVNRRYADFQFGEAAQALYAFVWEDFCDWYLEAAKIRMRTGNAAASPLPVLAHVLQETLRLLHPLMPFITEEIWAGVRARLADSAAVSDTLVLAKYPEADESKLDPDAEKQFAIIQGIVRAVRNARTEFKIEPAKPLETLVDPADMRHVVEQSAEVVRTLARIDPLRIITASDARPDPRQTVTSLIGNVSVFVPMAGLIDVAAERKRLEKELTDARTNIERIQRNLADPQFAEKAPEEVVDRERARLESLTERQAKVQELLATLPR